MSVIVDLCIGPELLEKSSEKRSRVEFDTRTKKSRDDTRLVGTSFVFARTTDTLPRFYNGVISEYMQHDGSTTYLFLEHFAVVGQCLNLVHCPNCGFLWWIGHLDGRSRSGPASEDSEFQSPTLPHRTIIVYSRKALQVGQSVIHGLSM